jgi:hypothetical protein
MSDTYSLDYIVTFAKKYDLPVWQVLFSLNLSIPLEYFNLAEPSPQVMDQTVSLLIRGLENTSQAQEAHAELGRDDIEAHWITLFEQEMQAATFISFEFWLERHEKVPEGADYRKLYISRLIEMARSKEELGAVENHEFFDDSETLWLLVEQRLSELIGIAPNLGILDDLRDHKRLVLHTHDDLIVAREDALILEMWEACGDFDSRSRFMSLLKTRSVGRGLVSHYEDLFASALREALSKVKSFGDAMDLAHYCGWSYSTRHSAITRLFDTASTSTEYEEAFVVCIEAELEFFRDADGDTDEEKFHRILVDWANTASDHAAQESISRKMLELINLPPENVFRRAVISFVARTEVANDLD